MNNRSNRRSFLRKVTISSAFVPLTVSTAQPRIRHRVRFAIVSDGHFGQPETNYLRFHQEMIGWLNEEFEGKGLDFVVLNGDLIHNAPEYLSPLKAILKELSAPHYVVKGNHDMVSASTWKDTWGYEENHSFELGDYAFLLGSTSNEAGEYLCANLDWLRTCLNSYGHKKAVFLFLHINQNGLTKHSVSCPEVVSVMETAPNLAAVFHGHDHDQDNVIYSNQHPYLFDGHLGGSWGTNYRGYRIVEIDVDGQIRTYQCNPAAFRVNTTRL